MTHDQPQEPPPDSLEQRLQALPRKVSEPFRQLLAAKQLDSDVLARVLDAGELSGAPPHRLIAFAIAYLQLGTQGVPVARVIQMAKDQGRRINLAWSPARWRTERDRLSRAESLICLSRNVVDYDVSDFEKLLPERFPGYLIRTSRRLGMEGFRQCHCVASYHPQLDQRRCAIAAVFVDRQRWTVQLFRTDDLQAPLRLGQIRTRFNGCPAPEVIDRIRAVLGMPPEIRIQATSDCNGGPGFMQVLRQLLPVLRGAEVSRVEVSFDGSGGWGEIDSAFYLPREAADVGERRIALETPVRHGDGQSAAGPELTEISVDDAIRELTQTYLDETEVNWVSDEGGFGCLEIDVARGSVLLDVNTRYVDSENAFWSERDILTGESL